MKFRDNYNGFSSLLLNSFVWFNWDKVFHNVVLSCLPRNVLIAKKIEDIVLWIKLCLLYNKTETVLWVMAWGVPFYEGWKRCNRLRQMVNIIRESLVGSVLTLDNLLQWMVHWSVNININQENLDMIENFRNRLSGNLKNKPKEYLIRRCGFPFWLPKLIRFSYI